MRMLAGPALARSMLRMAPGIKLTPPARKRESASSLPLSREHRDWWQNLNINALEIVGLAVETILIHLGHVVANNNHYHLKARCGRSCLLMLLPNYNVATQI